MLGRAQSAMEYILNHGWAILTILIVGVVFWEIGLFDIRPTAWTSEGFVDIKPIEALCYAESGGRFECVFVNNKPYQITVNYVKFTRTEPATIPQAAIVGLGIIVLSIAA